MYKTIVTVVMALSSSGVVAAQEAGRSVPLRSAFPVVASPSVVRIVNANAYGTIVGDGLIVTRASALPGNPRCQLRSGQEFPAEIAASDPGRDLALLTFDQTRIDVDKTRIAPIVWASDTKPGDLLAAVAADKILAVGVLAVQPRPMPPRGQGGARPPQTRPQTPPTPARGPSLGVYLKQSTGPVTVERVVPGSPAAKSGVEANDVIVGLAGVATPTAQVLVQTLRAQKPGTTVKLSVERAGTSVELSVVFAAARTAPSAPGTKPSLPSPQKKPGAVEPPAPAPDKRKVEPPPPPDKKPIPKDEAKATPSDKGDELTKSSSARLLLQHDLHLPDDAQGAPLFDLDGRLVGMHLARTGRVDAYAVPASQILAFVQKHRH